MNFSKSSLFDGGNRLIISKVKRNDLYVFEIILCKNIQDFYRYLADSRLSPIMEPKVAEGYRFERN